MCLNAGGALVALPGMLFPSGRKYGKTRLSKLNSNIKFSSCRMVFYEIFFFLGNTGIKPSKVLRTIYCKNKDSRETNLAFIELNTCSIYKIIGLARAPKAAFGPCLGPATARHQKWGRAGGLARRPAFAGRRGRTRPSILSIARQFATGPTCCCGRGPRPG